MTELYPLKFEPILKDKIWGGNSLAARWGKSTDNSRQIGECWEISSVADNLSTVSNGFLAGNNIEELIEVYMGDLVGEAVYEKYGVEFPLLIKFIEANADLSIQVHPGDQLAKERHNAYGKTEMWYILDSAKGAKIYSGFRKAVTKEEYQESLKNGTLDKLMNSEEPEPGDVFFTPAGRIHAIGAGNILVEIQQTSDITYRIYDWNRKEDNGNTRELHTDLALDAIDYNASGSAIVRKDIVQDKTENLITCNYFVTNILHFGSLIRKDYNLIDSFVIYICLEGEFLIHWDKGAEIVSKGETVLLPAMITDVVLEPRPESKLLEVIINPITDKSFQS
jgi:mannose-6-phosphate isomerase